mmetsp:Transcript_43860/g.80118  ORF Transcript_43860/g.80118 Transcript_43860/m.80118 type:complete len:162 (-) Transcript_43860:170-655(-)
MGLPAGVPALGVLIATIVGGVAAGTFIARLLASDTVRRATLVHASTTGVVAVVFWIWALRTVLHGRPDLGVVSFAAVLGADLVAFLAATKARACGSCTRYHKAVVVLSCGLVSINYGLALFIVEPGTVLFFYMVAGVLCWLAFGVWGFYVHSRMENYDAAS